MNRGRGLGGILSAVYFGLYGKKVVFETFLDEFLYPDIEA